MPVPDYQTLMRPLLAYYGDGQERRISSVRDSLARDFALTPADLEERIPSGRAKTFQNRVGWATTYLYRTGLLERPARSVYRITPRGRQVLEANQERIDLGVLDQFPEFREFRDAAKGVSAPTRPLESPEPRIGTTTPEETMDVAYAGHREALKLELLDGIRSQSPEFFEQLVLDVLLAMGYGGSRSEAARRLGRSGDAGLDGVIWEDRLGLDLFFVQAKRWRDDSTVGRPEVQGFVGALQGAHAPKGVFITASAFSTDAQRYAENVSPRVILIDGSTLAELMIDHGVGVSATQQYVLKKVDEDYFGSGDDATG